MLCIVSVMRWNYRASRTMRIHYIYVDAGENNCICTAGYVQICSVTRYIRFYPIDIWSLSILKMFQRWAQTNCWYGGMVDLDMFVTIQEHVCCQMNACTHRAIHHGANYMNSIKCVFYMIISWQNEALPCNAKHKYHKYAVGHTKTWWPPKVVVTKWVDPASTSPRELVTNTS